MSAIRATFFKIAKQELNGNKYSIDTFEDGKRWVHCYFLSERRNVVYLLSLSTATFELERKLKNEAADRVRKKDPKYFDFQKQASEIMGEELREMLLILAEKDVPIYQKCVKIHSTDNYEIIKGVINVEVLTHEIVKNFITKFLTADENFWYSSIPVKFTEDQINSLF